MTSTELRRQSATASPSESLWHNGNFLRGALTVAAIGSATVVIALVVSPVSRLRVLT